MFRVLTDTRYPFTTDQQHFVICTIIQSFSTFAKDPAQELQSLTIRNTLLLNSHRTETPLIRHFYPRSFTTTRGCQTFDTRTT